MKSLAKQIANDSAFSTMLKDIQCSVSNFGHEDQPISENTVECVEAMQLIMKNPQVLEIVEKLGGILMQVNDF